MSYAAMREAKHPVQDAITPLPHLHRPLIPATISYLHRLESQSQKLRTRSFQPKLLSKQHHEMGLHSCGWLIPVLS